jgi:hypothetical protein
MLKTPNFWGGLVLFSLLYSMLTGYGSAVVTVLWSMASGVLIMLLLRLTSVGDDGKIAIWGSILTTASIVLGTLMKSAVGGGVSNGWDAAAVALAALSAWGFETLRGLSRTSVCFLCKTTVGKGAFSCPRCGQSVCARPSCWSGRHLRCTSCLEREVVLLPAQEDWWTTELGPRVGRGACDSCYKEAHETDLRACGRCPLLMCRRCWDHHNGQCTRCKWRIARLPRAIWPFLTQPPPMDRARKTSSRPQPTRAEGRGGGRQ